MKIFSVGSENDFSIDLTPLNNQTIKFIKYGNNHFVIVTSNNNVFVNEDDEEKEKIIKINYLNFGNIKFIDTDNSYTFIVNDNNEFYLNGFFCKGLFETNKFTKLNLKFNEKIKAIRCGKNHLFILTFDGSIFGLGNNKDGQLGLQKEIKSCEDFTKVDLDFKVQDIRCGYISSLILDSYGNIYSTGQNFNGVLGLNLNTTETIFKFTKIELPFKVIKIFIDLSCSFIVNENFELYGCGYNFSGQLGLGDGAYRNEFTRITIDNYINYNNIEFHKSFNDFTLIKNNNAIYFSGESDSSEAINLIAEKYRYTKLNVDTKCEYNYLLLLSNYILIVDSEYKINEEGSDKKLNLFSKLQKNQLTDIDFC